MLKIIFRAILVIIAVYCVIMAVVAVQYFFDRGDMKKAAKVIYEFRPQGPSDNTKNATLAEQMAAFYKISTDDLYCETQIVSRYEGHVLVECGEENGFQADNRELNFYWLVNVVAGRIDGKNKLALQLMPNQ